MQLLAFIGETKVSQKIIDLDRVKGQDYIYSPLMLNFILEHFNTDLEMAIYRQRLFMTNIKEELEEYDIEVFRRGDDLYVDRGKLSVSIVASSVTSTLLHIGLNIQTEGTPVRTSGLRELGIIDISSFAEGVMLRYKHELEQIYEARCLALGLHLKPYTTGKSKELQSDLSL